MKRSYGTAYDSPSGVGVILGLRTGKVLFIGIRNKYCSICDMAEARNIEPRKHKCYRNFDRYASSTRMESDAIVEGFKCSIEMHGLIYRTVVADGDSNVYQSIIHNKPYVQYKTTVKKVECTNHLLRNLCRKLRTAADATQSKICRRRGFVQLRNVIRKNILNIRKEVVQAAAARRDEKLPDHLKAIELQKDILSIPSHVFGEHKRCRERGRTCVHFEGKKETNYVPFLRVHGLYDKVQQAVAYLSGYSDSLLLNLNNNPAESFNSKICKTIAAKRLHFGKRGAYNARVEGSVVQHNTQEVLTEIYKKKTNNVPSVIETLEKRRQRKVARTRLSRQMHGRTRKLKGELGTDRYYGPRSEKPDLSQDVFEQLRENHMQNLSENAKNSQEIERDTRDQNESDLWHTLKQGMLTASNFGPVCRMRPTTSCAATVKNILYPPSIDTAAMKYGREREETARKELSTILQKEIKKCGLFIDKEHPCLGASPDGLLDEDGIVEIKCPFSAQNLTAEEAIQTLPQLKGIFDKKNLQEMNQNHKFFYQVQGQLNITRRTYCIFAIWTSKNIKIIRVSADRDFWEQRMLPFLTRFYYECMLPEILDSRHNRHMPIRNPNYILQAKEEASIKKFPKKRNEDDNTDNENVCRASKRLKHNVSPAHVAITSAVSPNKGQDDDCRIIENSDNEVDTNELQIRRRILDDMIPCMSYVRSNVLPVNNTLNDESLDLFLRIIRETSSFETQSVLYLLYPNEIVPSCSAKSLQIIGGQCTNHWRCIYVDDAILKVYDSLPECTNKRLVHEEKEYIRRCYPNVNANNIIFEKVQRQPDSASCGIYAAAFATTIALGGNPCEEKYSIDVQCMRQHFMTIVENKKLLRFPTQ